MNLVEEQEQIKEKLREFYNSSQAYAEHLAAEDENYFRRYLSLIDRYAAKAEAVLDAGCGTGLSSYLLSKKKKKVVGIDLSELFLKQARQRETGGNLFFAVADMLSLPFPNMTFDLVGSYLVIEFLPDVEKGLEEMGRVLRKGGILLIIAPNLLSPIWPFKDFFRMLEGGPSRPVWCESPRMALSAFLRNLFLSFQKIFQRKPRFLYRQPDLTCRNVVGRDSDSVYLAHPTDLVRFLKARGFRILRSGSESSLLERLFPFLSVSVEVVAQKL
jgi:SAM-dependent methyltransferase